ncbi:hypothetical protein M513_01831 [Trichuris suis]|uniref:Ephrin RBD domain-containing protein n=1 Tax=Trichuris suis TaxID=68888 RepID=A0A085MJC4_9BILA|nr:hypothetical protein M513_01831 [Trichuris suis]
MDAQLYSSNEPLSYKEYLAGKHGALFLMALSLPSCQKIGPLVFILCSSNAAELSFTARYKVTCRGTYFLGQLCRWFRFIGPRMIKGSMVILELFSFLLATPAFGRQLPSIFWNSSSSLFRPGDPGISTLKAELMDSLEIHCPFYNDSVMLNSAEYSIIYMVSEYGYENCVLDEERPVGQCYSPYKETVIRLVIREFTPIPNGLEFEPGQTYYFISTSDGSMSGVHNRFGGLCASASMKFQIRVGTKGRREWNTISQPVPPRQTSIEERVDGPLRSIDGNQLPRNDERLSLPLAAESPMELLEEEQPSHLSIYELGRQIPPGLSPYTGEEDMNDPWRHHPRRPPLILYEIHEMLSPEDQAVVSYSSASGGTLRHSLRWAVALSPFALALWL